MLSGHRRASIDAPEPTPVEELVRFVRHADDPVPPQFKVPFLDEAYLP